MASRAPAGRHRDARSAERRGAARPRLARETPGGPESGASLRWPAVLCLTFITNFAEPAFRFKQLTRSSRLLRSPSRSTSS